MNYYNEIDPHCCQWLRNLISAGLIPDGFVDERSIEDVRPEDLDGYDQCHFFAGIAGWALALQLAGVPATEPLWTCSCPCQPFSAAGEGEGFDDPRHLWPRFFQLARARKPVRVFGEQVERAVRHGWLDGVFADMEGEGYACGAAVLGAHSVGAPHIRQRIYWVADSSRQSSERRARGFPEAEARVDRSRPSDGSVPHGFADGREDCLGMGNATRKQSRGATAVDAQEEAGRRTAQPSDAGPMVGAWSEYDIVNCRRGFSRRTERGTFPLAHGIPRELGRGQPKPRRMEIGAARTNHLVRLKAYGNAIVPPLAGEFIAACYECF